MNKKIYGFLGLFLSFLVMAVSLPKSGTDVRAEDPPAAQVIHSDSSVTLYNTVPEAITGAAAGERP